MNNDLISRSWVKHNVLSLVDSETRIYAEQRLDNAPTVEPIKQCKYCKHCGNEDYCSNCHSDHSLFEYYERPQGEWIMQRHDIDGCFYTCSNCGRMIRVPLFIDDPEDNETLADYPFCHCGADMRGARRQ